MNVVFVNSIFFAWVGPHHRSVPRPTVLLCHAKRALCYLNRDADGEGVSPGGPPCNLGRRLTVAEKRTVRQFVPCAMNGGAPCPANEAVGGPCRGKTQPAI